MQVGWFGCWCYGRFLSGQSVVWQRERYSSLQEGQLEIKDFDLCVEPGCLTLAAHDVLLEAVIFLSDPFLLIEVHPFSGKLWDSYQTGNDHLAGHQGELVPKTAFFSCRCCSFRITRQKGRITLTGC